MAGSNSRGPAATPPLEIGARDRRAAAGAAAPAQQPTAELPMAQLLMWSSLPERRRAGLRPEGPVVHPPLPEMALVRRRTGFEPRRRVPSPPGGRFPSLG